MLVILASAESNSAISDDVMEEPPGYGETSRQSLTSSTFPGVRVAQL